MGLFGKRLSMDSLKDAAVAAREKLESAKDALQDSASEWNAKAGEAGSRIAQKAPPSPLLPIRSPASWREPLNRHRLVREKPLPLNARRNP
jgi:hypothetical protein